jgi:hypothetical protein
MTNFNKALARTNSILADKVCLKTEEYTLTGTAANLPFTGISSDDVYSVIIKVKKAGSPADESHLVRYTQVSTDTPTTSHGMWMGNGDLFEITNKANIQGMKVISADGGAHILTIEYYGNN